MLKTEKSPTTKTKFFLAKCLIFIVALYISIVYNSNMRKMDAKIFNHM